MLHTFFSYLFFSFFLLTRKKFKLGKGKEREREKERENKGCQV